MLDVGAPFDAWVIFGVHADVHPEPDERIFLWHKQDGEPRRRVPVQRAFHPKGRNDSFDPGTLALRDAHLQSLLDGATGDVLAVQFPTLLWVKMAEGNRANACIDACVQLSHAYEQFGIAAQLLPIGLVVEDSAGELREYVTARPHWESDTVFVGHCGLVLPELGKLVDPTIEQIPPVRQLRRGPLVGGLTPQAMQTLLQGTATFGVPREGLIIGYAPVPPEYRAVFDNAPLLTSNGAAYQRAGINLATMVLQMFRAAPGVVDRLRRVPFPRIHALLDAIGDAPIEPDEAGDMRIAVPGRSPARLHELVIR